MNAIISDKKVHQVDTRLNEHEIIYQTLFEASTDAIFVETLDGHVLDSNSTACRLFGYTRQEFRQLTVTDLVPLDVAERLRQVI